jgi:uncharacterized protein (DUF433 family)
MSGIIDSNMSGIIDSNPEIFGGKPIVKGTRIPVELVFELFALEMSFDEIIEDYPSLTEEILKKMLEIAKISKKSLNNKDLDQYSKNCMVNL